MILYYSGSQDNKAVPEAVLGEAAVMLTAFDYLFKKSKKPDKRFRRHAKLRKKASRKK